MICTMQNAPVDQLHYYDGQVHGSYCGMFDPVHMGVFKAYYVFQAFHILYTLKHQLPVRLRLPEKEQEQGEIVALAASSSDHAALLLVNPLEQPQSVRVQGVSGPVRCRIIDEERNFSQAPAPLDGDELELSPYSVCLLEWEPEA